MSADLERALEAEWHLECALRRVIAAAKHLLDEPSSKAARELREVIAEVESREGITEVEGRL